MYIRYFLFLAGYFLFFGAFAQTQLIVRDAATGTPLTGASVAWPAENTLRYSDSTGTVVLDWPAGTMVRVDYVGYITQRVPLSGAARQVIDLLPAALDLPTAAVVGFRDNRARQEVAGSIELLDSAALRQFEPAGLLPALNRLPGVRFEQRSPGSFRISVRGSTIRAPFGVRNIKVYWNGIPFTEPGGDTPLNFLDLSNIDRTELIKGPAGSLYGAGTAGTLLLGSEPVADTRASASLTTGSYGFRRAEAQLNLPTAGGTTYQLRLAEQRTDGYRVHSNFNRRTAQLSTTLRPSANRRLDLHALYTDIFYQIPGGLNPEQYAADRRQARPGSEATNASINYNNLLLGGTHRWNQGRWRNETTLYGTFFYFDHPFNVDYKRETNLGGGGRTVVDYLLPLDRAVVRFSAGLESQVQLRMGQNFTNDSGAPGELNFNDEIFSNQNLFFGQASADLAAGWSLTAGLSVNQLRYDVDRTFDASAAPGIVASDFSAAWAPRLAVAKRWEQFTLHASLSSGFSPPTLDEFRTNEGSINTSLAPERGTNYEIGLRGRTADNRLHYDLTGFYFRLDETIVSYQDERGTQLFRNAGNTDQRGLEAALEWRLLDRPAGLLRALDWYGSYTYHDFRFADYEQGGTDFSDNRLPGTAPHTFTQVLTATATAGFYADLYWNYTDAIPLNDANTVYGEAYHLVRAKIGWRGALPNGAGLDIFAGSNNLLDQEFSLGNDLNPQFGNRYFQPAADRTFFAGVRLTMARRVK
jgi:iron complex outermembrane receptor protein